jgi:hypothetical protein
MLVIRGCSTGEAGKAQLRRRNETTTNRPPTAPLKELFITKPINADLTGV